MPTWVPVRLISDDPGLLEALSGPTLGAPRPRGPPEGPPKWDRGPDSLEVALPRAILGNAGPQVLWTSRTSESCYPKPESCYPKPANWNPVHPISAESGAISARTGIQFARSRAILGRCLSHSERAGPRAQKHSTRRGRSQSGESGEIFVMSDCEGVRR